MLHGAFKLKPNAILEIAGLSLPAFSGNGELRNRRTHMCVPDEGPIPVGTYYIIDRQSGGLLGFAHEWVKSDWFALYAKDRVIDDFRYCAGVRRGQFRLHAKGPNGLSRGCVTVDSPADFALLSSLLRQTERKEVPGTEFMAYGTLCVS
jgi:hypothetical protein